MLLQIAEKEYNTTTGQVTYYPLGWFYDDESGTSANNGLTYPSETTLNEADFFIVPKGASIFMGRTDDAVTLDGVNPVSVKVDATVTVIPAATFDLIYDFVNKSIAALSVKGMFSGYTEEGSKYRFNANLRLPVVIEIGSTVMVY